jgi:hypothetical protein
MALVSPGVEITVIDESFYTPAEPGTTPLVVVATAENKTNGAGTGTASATTKANAGKAFRLTSQRDLLDLFGVPFFEKTASGSPIHGSERNEYGLLAAYSLLGVTNSVFIVRADVDLDQLEPSAEAPGAAPTNGQWWLNTQTSAWGIKQWNGAAKPAGQKFENKTPVVLTDDDDTKIESSPDGNKPKDSVGSVGDYAVVIKASDDAVARIWYKSPGSPLVTAGSWVLVGSPDWTQSWATVEGGASYTGSALTIPTLTINGTSVSPALGTLDSLVAKINELAIQGVSAAKISNKLVLYSDGTSVNNAITLASVGTGAGSTATLLGLTAGTYRIPALQHSPHSTVPEWKSSDAGRRPTGSVWINTTEPNSGARLRVSKYSSATASWVPVAAPMYRSTHAALYFLDRSGGGAKLAQDNLFVQYNTTENTDLGDSPAIDQTPETSTFEIWRRRLLAGQETVISGQVADSALTSGPDDLILRESLIGEDGLSAEYVVSFTAVTGASSGAANAAAIATAINALNMANVVAEVSGANQDILSIKHKKGGDIRILETNKEAASKIFAGSANLYSLGSAALADSTIQGQWLATGWQPLSVTGFQAVSNAPANEPQDGQLWYNPEVSQVDLMVHNGKTWVGYLNGFGATSPGGVQVTATRPTVQSDGTALVDNDIWVSTADLENFPTIYRYVNAGTADAAWVLVDKTDQVTEDGVLFADARYGLSGQDGNTAAAIVDLLTSNYLDPDAPDPSLYPKGMLLWNTRRSGGNVKRYANNYIDTTGDNPRYDTTNSPSGLTFVSGESTSDYATDRWTTASANNEDGSGAFGRKAQRKVVVSAMKSAIDTSQEARDEERRNYNIISAPGYPEVLSNLINLNIDRGVTAFVVGDTPLRLKDDATTLTNWGTNAVGVTDNGDEGIVSYDEYCAVYYPNGFTTDLAGSNAVVPASHMMLRTITLSDQASYPWFAPAGTRRGGITNATSVGYIDSLSGEFQTVSLNEGQRDVLYDLKVNPIPFFVGVGLVAYGQKTRARNASALDRVNVARLVVYLRSQLKKLARPYIFEPNDKFTRDEVKQAVESLLLELVGLRALNDFAVVCDESNNTPSRVDRNELWVDIAIEPIKAVEFIYIPLRVKNTGEI